MSTLSDTSPPPSAPSVRRVRMWALLFVLAGNMLIDALEVSVVIVALPSIAADLGLSVWTVQWVMGGFALGFGALLLTGSRCTARWGRRPVYLTAMLIFTAVSVAGGFADTAAVLIATRAVKGICAALTAPTGLAIINSTFPGGPAARRAVSVYALFGAAGFTIGLLLSGAVTALNWRLTLLLSAPAALVLLLCALWLIPRDAEPTPKQPQLSGRLLRNGPLLRSAFGAATLNGSYQGLLLLTTFALQSRYGWSPWQTSLAILPACLPPALSGLFAARLVQRFGTTRLIAAGSLLPPLGYALLLPDGVQQPYASGLLPTMLLVGAAFVLCFAALNMQATTEVPKSQQGPATGLYQTAVQLSAVVVLSLTAVLHTVQGRYPLAVLLVTAVGAVGVIPALSGLWAERHRTARG